MLVAYIVVAAGVPLPSASRPAKSGERYPCEACRCGCDSAEHCWRNCCCHTLAERLAWAENNGVKPPDFALEAATVAGLDSGGRPLSGKVVKVAMVAQPATSSCGRSKASCCKSSTNEHTCCLSHNKPPTDAKAAKFLVAWRALGCHGQSLNWLAAVPTLVSVDLKLSDQLPLIAWLGPVVSDAAQSVAAPPMLPPPERA